MTFIISFPIKVSMLPIYIKGKKIPTQRGGTNFDPLTVGRYGSAET